MDYTINPRVYELFLKLTPQDQANFLKDLLKLWEEKHELNDKDKR